MRYLTAASPRFVLLLFGLPPPRVYSLMPLSRNQVRCDTRGNAAKEDFCNDWNPILEVGTVCVVLVALYASNGSVI